MNFLVDTHLLLWASAAPGKLGRKTHALMGDVRNTLWFSAASIWEVAIKRSLNKPGFRFDPGPLRAALFQMGYTELPVESRHVLGLSGMPYWHSDPFDRLLLAQAQYEGLTLLTSDQELLQYDAPVQLAN
jgi:PIN domain nuclease of toxin-antitoxin system